MSASLLFIIHAPNERLTAGYTCDCVSVLIKLGTVPKFDVNSLYSTVTYLRV